MTKEEASNLKIGDLVFVCAEDCSLNLGTFEGFQDGSPIVSVECGGGDKRQHIYFLKYVFRSEVEAAREAVRILSEQHIPSLKEGARVISERLARCRSQRNRLKYRVRSLMKEEQQMKEEKQDNDSRGG